MNKSITTTNDNDNNNTAIRFLINLQLLGFVPEKFTHTGVFSKIVFDEHMFSHANNNKAFEATSHFLFHKLDSQRTLLEFAKCWPLTETADYRRQSREYRSIAYRWLDELRIQQCLPGRITLRKSYFEDCRGEKMNIIMFAFSTFVLQKVVDQRRRHGMIKGKQHHDDNQYPVLRILGNSSVHMLSKEKLIEKLENEISRMSSSITQDEHTLRTSKEHWAKMARKIVSVNNNNGFSTIHSPIKEPRHKPNTHQWNGMHSILKTLTNRLDKLNQENKKLRQVATKKEEQLRQMNRSTDSIENVFNPLKTPFPVEKDPIINDLPPLVLPIQSINERKKRIQDYVDKLVIKSRNNSKKRQYEPEVTNDNQQQNNGTTSKKQKIVSSSPSLPSSPWLPKVEHEQHQIPTMPIKSVAPETGGTITTVASSSSASSIPRPSRYSITSTDVNSPVRQDRTSPVLDRQRRSATPHNHTIGSPFSYISEKVSPLSTTYPDYCENIVNQMVVDFHAQQTPERSKILSPIDNNNHTERLSISSPLKNWPTPTMTTPTKSLAKRLSTFSRDESSKLSSPQNQKLIAMKGRKTSIVVAEEEEEENEETTIPSYYEEDQLDYVYQHSPSRRSPPLSRRPSRSSIGLENRSSHFMNSTFASPAASSLDAYQTAMDEQDKNGTLGLLDETEPDMFYTSDFTLQT